MYSLTSAGELFLRAWIEGLERYREVLRGALAGFEADEKEGTP